MSAVISSAGHETEMAFSICFSASASRLAACFSASSTNLSPAFCAAAAGMLMETDYQMKTSFDDPQRLLELLILRLAQEARRG